MYARLIEYLTDPTARAGRRRAALVLGVVIVLAIGVGAVAKARHRPERLVAPAPAPHLFSEAGRAAVVACVCARCGTVVAQKPGTECEALRCPHCATEMTSGFYFVGGSPPSPSVGGSAPGARAAAAPMSAPPVPQSLLAPPPLSPIDPRRGALEAQRDNLGDALEAPFDNVNDWRLFAAAATQPPPQSGGNQVNYVPQRPGASSVCVCPGCGTRVPNAGHLYCPGLRCPSCGRSMVAGVAVGGTAPTGGSASATVTPPPQPAGGASLVAGPCLTPGTGGGMGTGGCGGLTTGPAAAAPSYTNGVSGVVQRNCLRCHSGSIRNLSTYSNLASYGKSGLLSMMVRPGGPMSRFLSPSEAQQLLNWVDANEPR